MTEGVRSLYSGAALYSVKHCSLRRENMSGASLDWSPPLFPLPGLVLHEEHIELFSEDFKALKNEVEGKVFQGGTLHFTGNRQAELLPAEAKLAAVMTSV